MTDLNQSLADSMMDYLNSQESIHSSGRRLEGTIEILLNGAPSIAGNNKLNDRIIDSYKGEFIIKRTSSSTCQILYKRDNGSYALLDIKTKGNWKKETREQIIESIVSELEFFPGYSGYNAISKKLLIKLILIRQLNLITQ